MRHSVVLGPAVSGSWYPRDRKELSGLVDGLLERAAERGAEAPGSVGALIVPHAGFVYSGAVAASAFVKLRGRAFDRIVLLGPSHYFGFHGAAIPDAATAYRTPLGDVAIDREAIVALREAIGFRADDRMFEPEHALEAELPFLQRVLSADVPVVPVLMGGYIRQLILVKTPASTGLKTLYRFLTYQALPGSASQGRQSSYDRARKPYGGTFTALAAMA